MFLLRQGHQVSMKSICWPIVTVFAGESPRNNVIYSKFQLHLKVKIIFT